VRRNSQRIASLAGVFLVGVAIWLLAPELPMQDAGFAFQSIIPTPPNTHFVRSDSGGRIWCGLQQSSVWLEIPIGFTSEGGAEFRCDPVDTLSQSRDTSGAWEDRGYLIGFYATGVPIVKPLDLVFEVDPAQVGVICTDCFSARYYDAGIGQWRSLPTSYDIDSARVHVEFERYLPTSGYPAYEDRFLIALFMEDQATATSTATSSATATASFTPTASPTSTPSPPPSSTPSATRTPAPPAPFPLQPTTSTATLPTLSLSPTSTSTPETLTPTATVIPTSTPIRPQPPAPPLRWVLAILSSVAALLVLAVLFVLFWKRRKPG